jgi:DNA-binding transcriptional LysR family regulator
MVRLHKGEFDFCIAVSSVSGGFQPVTDPTALARDWLFTDHFVLVADARNQMVTDDIDFETFCQLQHVETRFGGGLSSMIERTLLLMPDRPDTTMLVSTYALAIDAIVGTAKTAIVPMMVAQHAARVYDLKIVAQPFVVPDLVESLYWHKRNDADPAHVWVRNFLKSFSEQSDFRAHKCLMAQQA